MKLIDLNDLKNFKDNSVITIGFFDGLHVGNQVIFNTLKSISKEKNYKSVVITFDESVLSLFKMSKQICSVSSKLQAMKENGIDYVLLLKVSDNFMSLSAFDFIERYLNPLNCKSIVCGSDFSFGKNKQGNIEFLRKHSDYEIVSVDDVIIDDKKISSTYIRNLLTNGEVKLANSLLYKNFNIESEIIHGKQIGRTIGFKTANLKVTDSIHLLKKGVYFGYAIIFNKKYKAMINVGVNPTIDDSNNLKVEAHILSFEDDIYLQNIDIEFLHYHRNEMTFNSLDELKKQLDIDKDILIKTIM